MSRSFVPLRRPSNCELAYKTTKVIKRFTTQAPTYPVAQPPLLYRLQLALCPRAAVCLPHTLRVPMRARASDRNSGNCSLPLLSLSSAMRWGGASQAHQYLRVHDMLHCFASFCQGLQDCSSLPFCPCHLQWSGAGSHNLRDRLSHLQVVYEGLQINKSSCDCARTQLHKHLHWKAAEDCLHVYHHGEESVSSR